MASVVIAPTAPPCAQVLFFTDCEMTGLDVCTDHVLEIYIQVTNNQLEPLDRLHIVLACPQHVLDGMGDWCTHHHGLRAQQRNGLMTSSLLDDVGHSQVTYEQASARILALIDKHTTGSVMLAGCTVQNDRAFLVQHMPSLKERIHYRVMDISSIKEAALRFVGPLRTPSFHSTHRAKQDVEASIRLAKYLKESLFDPQAQINSIANPPSHRMWWRPAAAAATTAATAALKKSTWPLENPPNTFNPNNASSDLITDE